MILFSVGVGAASPVAITAAISTDPQLIGAASGLYGFMQMANGALCTLIVGLIPADPAFAAATVLLAGLLLGQSFFLLTTRPAFRSLTLGRPHSARDLRGWHDETGQVIERHPPPTTEA